MNSTENKINKDITDFNRKGLINTMNISDGNHTFRELYEQLFKTEEALNDCTNQLIEVKSDLKNIM